MGEKYIHVVIVLTLQRKTCVNSYIPPRNSLSYESLPPSCFQKISAVLGRLECPEFLAMNKNPCNWDTQFDSIRLECTFCVFTSITGSQFLKIIHQLFNSLVIPIFFLYGIGVWGGAYQSKYIDKIYTFFKRALRFGTSLSVFNSKML